MVKWSTINKGFREANYIIAAYNSYHLDKADYICSGTDDQDTIQSAIDDLSSGGKIVLLDGTFYINSDILPANDITIEGIGFQTIIKNQDTFPNTSHTIHVNGKSNVEIKNLSVDGNYSTHIYHLDPRGIYIYNSSDCKVKNVYVKDTKNQCIELYNSTSSYVVGCICENAGDDGISIYNSTDSFVLNNISRNNTFDGGITRSGIEVEGSACKFNTISNNICYSNLVGIDIECSHSTFSSNVTRNNQYYGFFVHGSDTKYNSISNNVVGYNEADGIRFSNYTSNNILNGNVIEYNDKYGIYIWKSSYNLIQGNYFINNSQLADNTYSDIRLTDATNPATYNIITNNSFMANAANKVQYHIRETGAEYNVYNNNRFYGSPSTAKWNVYPTNQLIDPLMSDTYHNRNQTTDANGRITVSISPVLEKKPSICVVLEGNYLWYVYSWTTDGSGYYNDVTIQITDTSGVAVGSGITAHVFFSI